jgi:hypothetical protein
MFQIKHMLAAAVTAFMAGNQAASMPDFDMQRMDTRFHPGARDYARPGRVRRSSTQDGWQIASTGIAGGGCGAW